MTDCAAVDYLNDQTNDQLSINEVSELNIYGAVNGDTETGYPKGDTNGSLSDASTIPTDDHASVEVFAGDDLR